MGLPPRIAIPILVVFAAVFLGIMGYLLKVGFGTSGSAFGPGAATQSASKSGKLPGTSTGGGNP